MTTCELKRLLNEDFGELSVREGQVAVRASELYRDRTFSHWNELREKSAIAALQGILANAFYDEHYRATALCEDVAASAVDYADALIEELKKREMK